MSTANRILSAFEALDAHDAARANAAERFQVQGLPDAHDEQWRYANLRALDGIVDFSPAAAAAQASPADLPAPLPGFERVVIVDGRFDIALSADLARLAAQGIRVTRSGGSAGADAGVGQGAALPVAAAAATATADSEPRGLELLNRMFARETLTFACEGSAKLEICLLSSAAAGAAYPTLRLELREGATLQLVERHLGGTGRQLVAAQLHLDLAPSATVWHYRLQEYGEQLVFFDNYAATLARDARLTLCQIGAGAGTARHSAHIALRGERAELHWQALAVANQRQVNDTWVQVEHLARGTVTQQRFRGIAADQARVACSAELQVPAAGAGSRVQQSLRGLIDGRGAEVDLRPRLEIRTDDIKASHGATTGQLDENLLFYLLSRGIDPATARTLLKWAFLGDVLGEIQIPALREAAERAAAGHLVDFIATGALGADVADAANAAATKGVKP